MITYQISVSFTKRVFILVVAVVALNVVAVAVALVDGLISILVFPFDDLVAFSFLNINFSSLVLILDPLANGLFIPFTSPVVADSVNCFSPTLGRILQYFQGLVINSRTLRKLPSTFRIKMKGNKTVKNAFSIFPIACSVFPKACNA